MQESKGAEQTARFWELDFLRGIAILMMVAFHFFWDTNFFGFTNLALYDGFFGAFQKATAGAFLLLTGISLALSFNKNKKGFEKKSLLRGARVFSWGLLITVFSLVFFPKQPVFFGILHLIGASIILSIPLAGKKAFNFIAGAALIIAPAFIDFSALNSGHFFWVGLSPPRAALDFFPLIPWFGVVLLGLFFGNTLFPGGVPKIKLQKPKNRALDALVFFGKKSLLIYFVHQPVLFSIVFVARVLSVQVF